MSTPEDYPEAEEEQPGEGKVWDDQGKPVNVLPGGDEETEEDGGDEDDDVQPDEETDDGGGDEDVEKETSAG